MKSESFVSIVCVIDELSSKQLKRIGDVQATLDENYCDYEILLIVQKTQSHLLQQEFEISLKEIPCIRYLQLTNNVSNDVAFSAGLENAIGDFIVLFNLTTDPLDLITQSVEKCKSGTDVIVGISPFNQSLLYRLCRPFAQFLLHLADYHLPQNASSFRCLSRRAANAVSQTGKFHQQFFMRIQKTGYPMSVISYTSIWTPKRTFSVGFRELVRLLVFNSSAPLRLMSVLGFLGSFAGLLFAIYSLIVQFIKNDVVEGWSSTVLLICLFSMLQFMILAFISEYLARLLDEQEHKAAYSIVFEKTSKAMINQDRINVWEDSTTNDQNLVATARNN